MIISCKIWEMKNYFFQNNSDIPEAASGSVLYKKVFLEISQNSQENTCARDSGPAAKETLAQVLSCEF